MAPTEIKESLVSGRNLFLPVLEVQKAKDADTCGRKGPFLRCHIFLEDKGVPSTQGSLLYWSPSPSWPHYSWSASYAHQLWSYDFTVWIWERGKHVVRSTHSGKSIMSRTQKVLSGIHVTVRVTSSEGRRHKNGENEINYGVKRQNHSYFFWWAS